MTQDEIREAVLKAIRRVAPEIEPDEIDPATDLREQLDIDSMDFLNVVIGIDRELGVEIPEEDYPLVTTLDGCVSYLDATLRRDAGQATRS
jgi:acyl carrier protein